MKRMINKAAIAKTNYNSAEVGILTYHALQIKEEGRYLGHIMQGKRIVKTLPISCHEKSEEHQLNLDFGMLKTNKISDCAKKKGMEIRPEGYIILMNSAGDGKLHFELEKVDKKPGKALYKNSSALETGDIYACTFLRPGMYNVLFNGERSTSLQIVYPDAKISRDKVKEPIRVKTGGKYNKEIKALPMQGVVFEFEEPGQIEIQLLKAEQDRELVKKQVKRFKSTATQKAKTTEPKTYQWRNPKYANKY